MSNIEMRSEIKQVEELTKLLITNPERDIKKASKIYANLLDRHPGIIKEVQGAVPFRYWGRLEAVARGALDARLFYDFSIGAAQLRCMPATVQADVLDEGVDLVVGEGEHLKVKLENLTREQATQAFDARNKCLRSAPAQRAYIEKVKLARQKEPATTPDYEWIGGRLKINRAMQPNEILKIIAEGN
jgi:hypothetical protein